MSRSLVVPALDLSHLFFVDGMPELFFFRDFEVGVGVLEVLDGGVHIFCTHDGVRSAVAEEDRNFHVSFMSFACVDVIAA